MHKNYNHNKKQHLDWWIRENYLELLEDFRKGKMKSFEFCTTFEKINKLTGDITDILESNLIFFSPYEKLSSFSNLLKKIFDLCSTYLKA